MTGIERLQQAIATQLQQRRAQQQLRTLTANHFAQTEWLDLNHNDYLGLRYQHDWQTKVWQRCRALPIGAGGSRLLGGEFAIFQQLEQQFARFKNSPRALFFPSGYAANASCVPALAQALPHARFFSDQLNHASLIDGFRLAKIPAPQRFIYPHLNYTALEQALQKSRAAVNIIITESLFSMDGDTCDLTRLSALAQQFRGVLLIDEAHAVGVCGNDGSGLIAAHNLDHQQLISVNTCGKACGSNGAFVCGPTWFIDYLINTARHFIYTTAPSPWSAVALQEAMTHIRDKPQPRQHLATLAQSLRATLRAAGFDIGTSDSHIIPLLVTDTKQALQWAKQLAAEKISVGAIRPPTVPVPRLRLSLHAALDEGHIERLLSALHKSRGAVRVQLDKSYS